MDTATEPEVIVPDDGLTHDRIAELGKMLEQHFDADDAWHYTGPLEEGQTLAHRDRYVVESTTPDGLHVVLLGDAPDPTWTDHAEFGCGNDPEAAWRYALGALLGPLEDDDPATPVGGVIVLPNNPALPLAYAPADD